jgi:hypothetical protein
VFHGETAASAHVQNTHHINTEQALNREKILVKMKDSDTVKSIYNEEISKTDKI